ncbi:hypothetical protein D9613_008177 [Agrocybe pediades]|uniref:Uncharacterized protein n=1 Tax=Agrocybe pediades TaxID=84607 RepID=A0A8H4QN40_9AGAR|nr:hypothetical protein D9613_008177 [Agrocybe pediades]
MVYPHPRNAPSSYHQLGRHTFKNIFTGFSPKLADILDGIPGYSLTQRFQMAHKIWRSIEENEPDLYNPRALRPCFRIEDYTYLEKVKDVGAGTIRDEPTGVVAGPTYAVAGLQRQPRQATS